MNPKLNASRMAVTTIASALLLLSAYWIAISREAVQVVLSQDAYCKWRRNEWLTGKSSLLYYQDNHQRGSVQIKKGIFESPAAMFAGSQPNTVICVYILDTTIAVFVVDFARSDAIGTAIPNGLRNLVDSSNFYLRACTWTEVALLKREIESNQRLSKQTFGLWKRFANPVALKQNLLHVVDLGTMPQSQRTGDSAFEAHPHIPPEG